MAYDKGLAERLYDYFEGRKNVEVKKMFGGLCFMVSNHMCCGIIGDTLMARVGPDIYDECLAEEHARVMDFSGRAMKGMVYVAPEGIVDDAELVRWLEMCESFVKSLPPKH